MFTDKLKELSLVCPLLVWLEVDWNTGSDHLCVDLSSLLVACSHFTQLKGLVLRNWTMDVNEPRHVTREFPALEHLVVSCSGPLERLLHTVLEFSMPRIRSFSTPGLPWSVEHVVRVLRHMDHLDSVDMVLRDVQTAFAYLTPHKRYPSVHFLRVHLTQSLDVFPMLQRLFPRAAIHTDRSQTFYGGEARYQRG
jgi:hypothetical protein